MSTPVRIQRKRTKGWKMPTNTVYVGRGSRWGNPFRVGHEVGTRAEAAQSYRNIVCTYDNPEIFSLRGKNLACWCPLDQPCHADVLLDLANTPLPGSEG